MKKQSGFTFIEILVTTGVIALISAVTAQIFLASTRSSAKSDLLQNIKQNGELSVEVMSRMIQSAQDIPLCSGATTQSLTIENPNGGATTFTCLLDPDSEATRIASVSALGTHFLTSAGLTLGGDTCANSSIEFICTDNPGFPPTAQINFSLSQLGTPTKSFEQATIPFQTTVTVRNAPSQ